MKIQYASIIREIGLGNTIQCINKLKLRIKSISTANTEMIDLLRKPTTDTPILKKTDSLICPLPQIALLIAT